MRRLFYDKKLIGILCANILRSIPIRLLYASSEVKPILLLHLPVWMTYWDYGNWSNRYNILQEADPDFASEDPVVDKAVVG
jgi:hypothetical protein